MKKSESQKVKRTQRDYSLVFKLQVVNEVEKGFFTYKEAQNHYGIQGRATVLVWLRKHGSLDWSNQATMSKGKTPQQRIKELEKALARAKEDNKILNIAIDIMDDEFGCNIRKKYLPEQLEKHKKKDSQNQ